MLTDRGRKMTQGGTFAIEAYGRLQVPVIRHPWVRDWIKDPVSPDLRVIDDLVDALNRGTRYAVGLQEFVEFLGGELASAGREQFPEGRVILDTQRVVQEPGVIGRVRDL